MAKYNYQVFANESRPQNIVNCDSIRASAFFQRTMDILLLFNTAIVRHFHAIEFQTYFKTRNLNEFFNRVSRHHHGLAVLNLHQKHILKIS